MFKNIFLVNRWRKKIEYMWKLFLYIKGVCHETVAFFCPLISQAELRGLNVLPPHGAWLTEATLIDFSAVPPSCVQRKIQEDERHNLHTI